MSSRKLLLTAVACVSAAVMPASMADTVTATFTITITIQGACTVNAGPQVNFGTVPSTATANQYQTNTLSVICSNTLPYNVGLLGTNTGASANGTGYMVISNDQVPYELFQDSAHTTPWGNTVGTNTVAATGSGLPQSYSVYAQVLGTDLNHQPGTYSDIVTVTVTY